MMKINQGFAYIALLAALAVLMLVLTSASESVSIKAKREREQQLFFVGSQFRNAIASYYENSAKAVKQFPLSLDELVQDKRTINTTYHLRKIYRDPMSNEASWGLVKNTQQQIVGIYSLSSEAVLKTNVDPSLVTKEIKQGVLLYSDLKFIYTPKLELKR